MSSLPQRSIETLLDLVEIKLSCLDVYDREDAREKSYLENARRELGSLKSRRLAAANPAARIAALRLMIAEGGYAPSPPLRTKA